MKRALCMAGLVLWGAGCADFPKLEARALERFERPEDLEPPQVVTTTPAPGAVGVLRGVVLRARFSEAMRPDSLGLSATPGLPASTVAVSDDGREASWSFGSPLPFATAFRVTFSGTDVAGNPLAPAGAQLDFTTEVQDVTPPTLVATSPVEGANVGAATFEAVGFTFSEPVDAARFALAVAPPLTLGSHTASADGKTITVSLSGAVESTAYSFTLTGVVDLAGNALAGARTLRVVTRDDTGPSLTSSTPAAGAEVAASATSELVLGFSEAMSPTLTATLTPQGGAPQTLTPTAWSADARTASFALAQRLVSETSYRLEVTQATDASAQRNVLTGNRVVTFSTTDETPPRLLAFSVADGGGGAAVTGPLTLSFSEVMNSATVGLTLFPDGGPLTASRLDGGGWSFTPTSPLLYSQTYSATARGADLAGLPLAGDAGFVFRTVSQCALGACDPNAVCTPEVPPAQSVTCTCPAGYRGTGTACFPLLSSLAFTGARLVGTFAPAVLSYGALVDDAVTALAIQASAPSGATVSVRVGGVVQPGLTVSLPSTGGVLHVEVDVTQNQRTSTYDVALVNLQTRGTYLKASNSGAGDSFGVAVALSGDGTRLAVGAHGEASGGAGVNPPTQADNSVASSGAVYVFRRKGNVWSQEAYLKAASPRANDHFGYRLALSADGVTLAVGAYRDETPGAGVNPAPTDAGPRSASGAVHVFRRGPAGWAYEAFLKATNPGGGDEFGMALSLSSSGEVLAVGAPGEDSSGIGVNPPDAGQDESRDGGGAVYVFRRVGQSWSATDFLKASNTGAGDNFGAAVALSGPGHVLVVGAPNEDSTAVGASTTPSFDESSAQSGAAYVYRFGTTGWVAEAFLKASNTGAGDAFGSAVAVSADGTTAVIGAPLEDSDGRSPIDESAASAGAAYVFEYSGAWRGTAYLKATNAGAGDRFGAALALSRDGDVLAVGANEESSAGRGYKSSLAADDSAASAGAAYRYTRTGTVWALDAYVKASNTDANDFFGVSVALAADGSELAVGAQLEDSNGVGVNPAAQANNGAFNAGAVYLYRREGGDHTAFLKASNAGANDAFGGALALSADGRTLAVGAVGESSNGTGVEPPTQGDDSLAFSGAVYVFRQVAGTWSQEAYLKAFNPGANDRFGSIVSLSADGSRLAVGAHWEGSSGTGVDPPTLRDDAGIRSGAVYVFRREAAGGWAREAQLKASNTGAGDTFGIALALSSDGTTLGVGASSEDSSGVGVNPPSQSNDSASGSGAVYVFGLTDAGWEQQAYVKASNAGADDGFGSAVAIAADGHTLVVSASGEDSNGAGANPMAQGDNSLAGSGAAYVFRRSAGVWSQDAYLKASNPALNDGFGTSVAISATGDTVVVGSFNGTALVANSGAAHVFQRTQGVWEHQANLGARPGRLGDAFGVRVALAADGNTLAVGGQWEDSNGFGVNGGGATNTSASLAGAAWVFRRRGASWAQESYVKASNTEAGDFFGVGLALSGDGSLLAVGAVNEDSGGVGVDPASQTDNGRSNSGAAYLIVTEP